MAREGGTLRHHPRTLLSLIVVVACVLGTLVVNDAAFAEEGIDLNGEHEGITLNYTISVSQAQEATIDGQHVYGKYVDISPVTDENGEPYYDLDPQKYDNQYGNARYQFKADFTIKPGTLNSENNTMYFQLPPELSAQEVTETDILNNGKLMGKYTVSKDGLATLVFNDEVVSKNATAQLLGDFSFCLSAGDTANSEEFEWELPGTKTPVKFGKKYDLHVNKSMDWNSDDGDPATSRKFNITVNSKYGTPGTIVLNDTVHGRENGSLTDDAIPVKFSNVVVQKKAKDGKVVEGSFSCPNLDCVLPGLQAGQSYDITYRADFASSYGGKDLANLVDVQSNDGDKGTFADNARFDFTVPSPYVPDTRPSLSKVFSNVVNQPNPDYHGEGGSQKYIPMLEWKIVVNENGGNLAGWTLKDIPGTNLAADSVVYVCGRVRGSNGGDECTIKELPYTFAGTAESYTETVDGEEVPKTRMVDRNVYEIIVRTKYDESVCQQQGDSKTCAPIKSYGNKGELTKEGENSVASDGWYTNNSNPIEKTGVTMGEDQLVTSPDGQGEVNGRELTWKIAINGAHPRILTGPWEFSDSLEGKYYPIRVEHYLTSTQKEELTQAVRKAFQDAFGDDIDVDQDVNVGFNTGNDGFVVRCTKDLPADTRIEFQFTSTTAANYQGANEGFNLENKARIGDFEATGSLHFEPGESPTSFKKEDATGATKQLPGNGEQGHAFNELPTNGYQPYVSWKITIAPGTELFKAIEKGSDLTIKESLPEGMKLLPPLTSGTCEQNADNKHCLSGLNVQAINTSTWEWGLAGEMVNPNPLPNEVKDKDKDKEEWMQQAQAYSFTPSNNKFGTEPLVTATGRTGDVSIIIKNEMLKAIAPTTGQKINSNRQRIEITVRAHWTSWTPFWGQYHQELSYTNTASWSFSGQNGGEAQHTMWVYDDEKEVGKEFVGVKQGDNNRLPYQLDVNPKETCFGSSQVRAAGCSPATYEFSDTIRYPHIIGYGEASLQLDPTSVEVYEVNAAGEDTIYPVSASCDGNGNCGWWEGDATRVRKLDASEWSYTLESTHPAAKEGFSYDGKNDHTGAEWSEKITFKVPNGKHLYINYTYLMTGDYTDESWIKVDNSASFGATTAKPTDQKVSVNMKEAAAHVRGSSMSVFKVDEENNSKRLGGAVFDLYVWNKNSGEFKKTKTSYTTASEDVTKTNSDGTETITQHKGELIISVDENIVNYNTAYALKESMAPEGYQLNPDFQYFMFKNDPEDPTKTVAVTAPGGFGSTGQYAAAKIVSARDYKPMFTVTDPPEVKIALPAAGGTTSRWIVAAGVTLLLMSMMGTALLLRREAAIVA